VAQIEIYAIAVLTVIVACLAFGALFVAAPRWFRRGTGGDSPGSPASPSSWKSYFVGQGKLLFGFLAAGFVLAFVTYYLGPREGRTSRGGRLVEYRQINPSEHVVYEEQDVESYRHITVLARTVAPSNGSATVTVYGDPMAGGKQEISRMDSIGDSWAQWNQPRSSSKHITLKITNGATAPGATQVDVLLCLFPD
jgi:hypothetical protein